MEIDFVGIVQTPAAIVFRDWIRHVMRFRVSLDLCAVEFFQLFLRQQ